MNGRVLHFESPGHREIDALLPWHVNGTLTDEEHERVEAHLLECVRCQRELDWLRELRSVVVEPGMPFEGNAEVSLDRLRRRLDTGVTPRVLSPLRDVRAGWDRAPAWTRWALAAQLVLCVALAGALALPRALTRGPAAYHTLGTGSTPQSAEARLVVMFEPSISEGRLRVLVQGNGARIVDGPTDTGAYVLAVPRTRAGQALAALRHERGVQMVERLTPGHD